jgi:hypothetical protein
LWACTRQNKLEQARKSSQADKPTNQVWNLTRSLVRLSTNSQRHHIFLGNKKSVIISFLSMANLLECEGTVLQIFWRTWSFLISREFSTLWPCELVHKQTRPNKPQVICQKTDADWLHKVSRCGFSTTDYGPFQNALVRISTARQPKKNNHQ